MLIQTHKQRAETLLTLHHQDKLLVLPNVWDVMSTRLLTNLGFPAIATASAAIAFSRGYDDGQKIPIQEMLTVIRKVASSTHLPVSADFERGYSGTLTGLKDNVRALIDTGAVGLNIEDSLVEGGALRPLEEQAERIQTIRDVADDEDIPLVINARCDLFLAKGTGQHDRKVEESISRGQAYARAGANCFYPILLNDLPSLEQICEAVGLPVNVLATPNTASQEALHDIGVRRLSLGPGWLKAGVTELMRIAENLQNGGSFTEDAERSLSSERVKELLSEAKPPNLS